VHAHGAKAAPKGDRVGFLPQPPAPFFRLLCFWHLHSHDWNCGHVFVESSALEATLRETDSRLLDPGSQKVGTLPSVRGIGGGILLQWSLL
jgi:hypothetical protein